jgi:hypothetical protein
MKLALILLMAAAAKGQTFGQPSTLEHLDLIDEFKRNQIAYNTDERIRNEQARVDMENRIDKELAVLSAGQGIQDANIKALENAATGIKTLGVILVIMLPCITTIGGMIYAHKSKVSDKILDRLTTVEQASLKTTLSIPLLTNVVDRLSTVLIEGVHHPDDTHVAVDDLLDKLPSSISPSLAALSHEDHKELTGLMAERATDPEVTQKERNMAQQLMPVLDGVRALRELEK